MLKEQIKQDMIKAMKAKETAKLGTIRLINAAIKQKEVDDQCSLDEDDAAVLQILNKMIKQRRDAIAQFSTANRQDLVDQESAEIEVIETYLPQQLSEQEIAAAVQQAITETGATGVKDMGPVMNLLKERLTGQADMGKVSQLVKAALAG